MCILKQGLCLVEKHYIWKQIGLPLFTPLGTALLFNYKIYLCEIYLRSMIISFVVPTTTFPSLKFTFFFFVRQWLLVQEQGLMTWVKIIVSTKKYANRQTTVDTVTVHADPTSGSGPANNVPCWHSQPLDTGNCLTQVQALSHKEPGSEGHDINV